MVLLARPLHLRFIMAKKNDVDPESITAHNVDDILASAAAAGAEERAADAVESRVNNIEDALARIADTQAQMTQMMGLLIAKAAGGGSEAGELARILGPALERLAESNLAGAKLITAEQRRTHRPSNEFPHLRSVFNRRGVLLGEQFPEGHAMADGTDPIKPPLKCIMLLPWLAEWESLTREEVELLNLLQPGNYVVKRVDNSKVRIDVVIEYKVDGKTPSRLVINHETAYNNDNHRLWPSIPEWVRQALRQHDPDTARLAAAVMTDEEEEALIEAGDLVASH